MDVGRALRNTSKGQLKYDRYWIEEGRTKEILDGISHYSSNIAINISPKILSSIASDIAKGEKRENEEEEGKIYEKPNVNTPKSASDVADSYFYEIQLETELPIIEYEGERLKSIQDIFNIKKSEYDNYSKEVDQQIEQEYQLLRRKNDLDAKRRAAILQKIEEAVLQEAREKWLLQREHYQSHVKKLSAKVQEAELKQKKIEEELKKRVKEQQELKFQLTNCEKEAESLVSKAIEKLQSCEQSKYLRIPSNDRINHMKKVISDIKNLSDESETKDLTIDDILNANILVKGIYETLQDITNDIEFAKIRAVQEQEEQAKVSQETATQNENSEISNGICSSMDETVSKSETAEVLTVSGSQKKINAEMPAKNKINTEAKIILAKFIASDAAEDYHRIMENLELTDKKVKAFANDAQNKKYCFELRKAITLPINAVSSFSGSHVKDKINRILSILRSKSSTENSKSVAYSFCVYLVAKQFVEQADRQISAQHSTAFPTALAIVGVWMQKPDVGLLILGHLYSSCPYLVPYYPSREKDQSDKDYYKFLIVVAFPFMDPWAYILTG
ncbi:nucleoporin GLE1-like isoform X2 [Stegodyphus dumicola]|uniref:nucleoporin GLE1-like isoform X2 n=1 Tax=Stegodyphus dumicola TaxID=202533 RepID=UPI0015ACD249|nr:nucleoporin GLE1-like isoform X2 [Stegodyphus dumicola]